MEIIKTLKHKNFKNIQLFFANLTIILRFFIKGTGYCSLIWEGRPIKPLFYKGLQVFRDFLLENFSEFLVFKNFFFWVKLHYLGPIF